METTTKIDYDVLLFIKQLQARLLERGVRATNKQLLSAMKEVSSRRAEEIIEVFFKKQEEDPIERLLANPYKGGKRFSAVAEHDVVF